MKAFRHTRYGSPDVISLEEVEKPVPTDNQILVKVQAASLNAYDWHLLTADIFLVRGASGLLKPKDPRMGADFAGTVEAVGRAVTLFKPGDEVSGSVDGALAEYLVCKETSAAPKPVNLSFEQAAAVPMAALTALQGLRDQGRIHPGSKVLINGASGGVGSFALQIAKALGAEVTAVVSPQNVEQARALGADHVIDYTREDFTRSGQQYDLILAVNGYHSIFAYNRVLAPNGIYVMAGGKFPQMAQALLLGPRLSRRGGQKMGTFMAKVNRADADVLRELIESGKVTPVIDRVFPFVQTAEALRYLGAGHARGKVVIRVG